MVIMHQSTRGASHGRRASLRVRSGMGPHTVVGGRVVGRFTLEICACSTLQTVDSVTVSDVDCRRSSPDAAPPPVPIAMSLSAPREPALSQVPSLTYALVAVALLRRPTTNVAQEITCTQTRSEKTPRFVSDPGRTHL